MPNVDSYRKLSEDLETKRAESRLRLNFLQDLLADNVKCNLESNSYTFTIGNITGTAILRNRWSGDDSSEYDPGEFVIQSYEYTM